MPQLVYVSSACSDVEDYTSVISHRQKRAIAAFMFRERYLKPMPSNHLLHHIPHRPPPCDKRPSIHSSGGGHHPPSQKTIPCHAFSKKYHKLRMARHRRGILHHARRYDSRKRFTRRQRVQKSGARQRQKTNAAASDSCTCRTAAKGHAAHPALSSTRT